MKKRHHDVGHGGVGHGGEWWHGHARPRDHAVGLPDTWAALYRGEERTPLQQRLVEQYPSFGACLRAGIE